MTERPGLDSWVQETRQAFLARLEDPDFCSRIQQDFKASDALVNHLRFGDAPAIDALIRALQETMGIEDPLEKAETQARVLKKMTGEAQLAGTLAADLLTAVNDVRMWLAESVYELLDEGQQGEAPNKEHDAKIARVLMELYHMGHDEFDPTDPTNAVNYNAEDGVPDTTEPPMWGHTPRHYLAGLIAIAVVARLMKISGRELLLSWAEAVHGTTS